MLGVKDEQTFDFDNFNDILSYLDRITDDNYVVVKCNNVDERSAINRLAYFRGYSTKAIYYDTWFENFIYDCGNEGVKCFGEMEWDYDFDQFYYKFFILIVFTFGSTS